MKQIIASFKNYYQSSNERRTGVSMLLGFIVLPAIGLSILFAIVYYFYL